MVSVRLSQLPDGFYSWGVHPVVCSVMTAGTAPSSAASGSRLFGRKRAGRISRNRGNPTVRRWVE